MIDVVYHFKTHDHDLPSEKIPIIVSDAESADEAHDIACELVAELEEASEPFYVQDAVDPYIWKVEVTVEDG